MTPLAPAPKSRLRGAIVAAVVVAAAALALWPVPLYNRLGFEFAAAMAVVVVLVSGWRAAGTAAAVRRASQPAPDAAAAITPRSLFPGAALARISLENSILLLPPLAVQALRAGFDPSCDVGAGLRFYAVLAIPACLYGTGFGFALGLAFRRGRAAFAAWVALALCVDAIWLVAQPPKFTYNPIVGFFPGPLYDAEIPFDRTLVIARAGVVVQALAAIALSVLAWDGHRLRLRHLGRDLRGERAAIAVIAAPLVLTLVLLHAFAAPLGIRIDRGFIQRTLGGRIDTPHVRLFYDRATLTPSRAAALAAEHEARWTQLAQFFTVAPSRPIGSYVYASAAQKKRLMGAGDTSFEDALHDEFHVNASSDDPHPVLTHEMAHIFAAQIDPWVPVCWQMGIHEGIAVAAEWSDESARLEMTPHEACAAMDSLGLLPEIQNAMSAWGFWTQPSARAYTACGSFVRWLVDTRGMTLFHTLWSRGDFERAYGEPLADLVAAWRLEIARLQPTPMQLRRAARLFGAGSIFTVRCAHEIAALQQAAVDRTAIGDDAGAESLWTRAVELDPAALAPRMDTARARLRRGDAAGAIALAQVIATDVPAQWRDRVMRIAGDAAWALERFALADSFYAAAAAVATGSAEARAFEVTRQVLADPRLAPVLCVALADVGASEATALGALARARAAAPEAALPRYLLGRRLFNSRDFQAARVELEAAVALAGLGPEANRAAQELAAQAEFAAARDQVERPASSEPGSGRLAPDAAAWPPSEAASQFRATASHFRALAAQADLPDWRRLGLEDWAYRAEAAGRAALDVAPRP